MKLKLILSLFAFLSIVAWGPFDYVFNPSTTALTNNIGNVTGSKHWVDKAIQTISAQANNIDKDVLKLGIKAYLKARDRGIAQKQVLTLVDYSKSSGDRRLWVIDLKNLKVLYNTWVAHGKNSGSELATSFSNKHSSLKSSLGVFVTDETYVGGKGYSMRIKGVEPGINDNAYDRSIVFHGARYVGEKIAKSRGMVGRSWGCFAVDTKIIKPLINTIKNHSVVVAYYPEKKWFTKSSFIN